MERDDRRSDLEEAADKAEREGSIPERRRTATSGGQGATTEDQRVAADEPEQSPAPEDEERSPGPDQEDPETTPSP